MHQVQEKRVSTTNIKWPSWNGFMYRFNGVSMWNVNQYSGGKTTDLIECRVDKEEVDVRQQQTRKKQTHTQSQQRTLVSALVGFLWVQSKKDNNK